LGLDNLMINKQQNLQYIFAKCSLLCGLAEFAVYICKVFIAVWFLVCFCVYKALKFSDWFSVSCY